MKEHSRERPPLQGQRQPDKREIERLNAAAIADLTARLRMFENRLAKLEAKAAAELATTTIPAGELNASNDE